MNSLMLVSCSKLNKLDSSWSSCCNSGWEMNSAKLSTLLSRSFPSCDYGICMLLWLKLLILALSKAFYWLGILRCILGCSIKVLASWDCEESSSEGPNSWKKNAPGSVVWSSASSAHIMLWVASNLLYDGSFRAYLSRWSTSSILALFVLRKFSLRRVRVSQLFMSKDD